MLEEIVEGEDEEEEEIFFPEAPDNGDENEDEWDDGNDNVRRLMEMTDINDYDDDDAYSVESLELDDLIGSCAIATGGEILPLVGHSIDDIKQAVSFVEGWDWTMPQQQRVRFYFFINFPLVFLFFSSLYFLSFHLVDHSCC